MPYNEEIDKRIEKMTSRWKNTARKKMFGGVCHLLSGNMFLMKAGGKNAGTTGKRGY